MEINKTGRGWDLKSLRISREAKKKKIINAYLLRMLSFFIFVGEPSITGSLHLIFIIACHSTLAFRGKEREATNSGNGEFSFFFPPHK